VASKKTSSLLRCFAIGGNREKGPRGGRSIGNRETFRRVRRQELILTGRGLKKLDASRGEGKKNCNNYQGKTKEWIEGIA